MQLKATFEETESSPFYLKGLLTTNNGTVQGFLTDLDKKIQLFIASTDAKVKDALSSDLESTFIAGLLQVQE